MAVARHPVARIAPRPPAIISASRARVGERNGKLGVNSTGRSQCATAGASVVLLTRTPLLILFTESLGVSFAVRIEEFLAASLPSCSEVGRCDVPIRPTFLGYGAEVLTELLQGRPTEKPVAIVDLINDKAGLEDNHMRDHRIVEGIGILGDIEILLHDTPRV